MSKPPPEKTWTEIKAQHLFPSDHYMTDEEVLNAGWTDKDLRDVATGTGNVVVVFFKKKD
jgi:hypothetical protein